MGDSVAIGGSVFGVWESPAPMGRGGRGRTAGSCGLDGKEGCLEFSACLFSGERDDGWVRNGGEGRDDADAGGEAFRAGISTFERLGSTSSGPGLSGRFMDVATELGGGEARERVDDIEPRWLWVRMEGEGEIGLVEEAGPLVNVGVCSGARYEANPIKVSATPSS